MKLPVNDLIIKLVEEMKEMTKLDEGRTTIEQVNKRCPSCHSIHMYIDSEFCENTEEGYVFVCNGRNPDFTTCNATLRFGVSNDKRSSH